MKLLIKNGRVVHPVTGTVVLQDILAENGLTNQVAVEYKTEHAELATLLSQGQADVALLPQPFVTSAQMNNDKLRVALDLTKEWDAIQAPRGGQAPL